MSAPKITIPPPPPPPPPPSYLTGASSPPSTHHQPQPQPQHRHHVDLERLASTSTPIQARKQQLYSHREQHELCSSPISNHSGHNHPLHQSPSKVLQNELRRSRHCLSRSHFSSADASVTSNEGVSPGRECTNSNCITPTRHFSTGKFTTPSGTHFHQNAHPSSSGHQHRCNKHRNSSRVPSVETQVKSLDVQRPASHNATSPATTRSGTAANQPTSAHIFDGSKKSRCILFSQIYLIAHVSITLCLNEIQDSKVRDPLSTISLNELILDAYLAYILVVSLIFFFLLRCYATPSELNDRNFNELTDQSPILFGATLLGMSELTLSGISILHCLETEFIILPLLKFSFSCFLMHFLLTQIIHSNYIGLRNIAIAHLLATQMSLWILSLTNENLHQEKLCNFTFDVKRFKLLADSELRANSSTKSNSSALLPAESGANVDSEVSSALPLLQSLLYILTHQFKLLTIFILITMWFTNNQSKINFIRAKLSDEEVIRASSMNPNKKRCYLKGFAIGMLFLALAIVTVLFPENETLRCCSLIVIQALITIISLSGLVIRRRKKYLNPKYQINVLKHHFIIFFTLFATYVTCFINIVILCQQLWHSAKLPSHQKDSTLLQTLSILAWSSLLLQITVQTYLLRLQGKKLVDMSHIFALLVTANLSLWMIDVSTELSSNVQLSSSPRLSTFPAYLSGSVQRILSMLVALNRYYCALIFVHFWKMRI